MNKDNLQELQMNLLIELAFNPVEERAEWKSFEQLLTDFGLYQHLDENLDKESAQRIAEALLQDAHRKGWLSLRSGDIIRHSEMKITSPGHHAYRNWYLDRDEGPVDGKRQSIDATDWTGTRLIYIDAQVLTEIRTKARELKILAFELNYRSEVHGRDIQGLAEALVALCDMAEPDLDLIDRVTAHPKFRVYAALAILIATIRGALGI